MTKIPKIEIKEVYVPKIRLWEVQPPILDVINKPVVDIPACVDAHRNNLTGLINEDELGTYQACGTFDIPSFEPLEYNPANFIYTSQYIPSFKQFTGVFSLALVGCSAPIILNLVKPVVKNLIKKLTKKKDKVE